MNYSKEELSKSGMFSITNRVNNRRYIFFAPISFQNSYKEQYRELNKGCHPSTSLQKDYKIIGRDNFEFNILDICSTSKIEYWITFYLKDGVYNYIEPEVEVFNLEEYKLSVLNKQREWGKIISKRRIGYKHTPETKDKIRQANIGKKLTAETKDKIRQSKIGRKLKPLSLETRLKMSERRKGKKHTPETISKLCRYTYKVTDPLGEIFIIKNLLAFCREFNLNNSHMNSIALGKRKQHKGYRVEII